MSKSNAMMEKLKQMRQEAVKDDPHQVQVKQGAAPTPASVEPAPVQATVAVEEKPEPTPAHERVPVRRALREKTPKGKSERATLIFTPSALAALDKLQTFLKQCGTGIKPANASMAANIALEFAAEHLVSEKDRLRELYQARREADGRRRAS